MKQYGKKLTALLLAACLLLGLAACGGRDGGKGGTDGQSGTVFVPTFTDVKLDTDGVEDMCFAGNYVYLMGRIDNETQVTETDPETGEEYTYYTYQQEYVLYRMNQDGTGMTRLEAYQSPQVSQEGWFYISGFTAGEDGTLYVTEYITDVTYDLPEDFDETTGNKYDYAVYTDTTVTKHLDVDGNELDRTEGGGDRDGGQTALAEQLGVDWISGTYQDGAGNTYAVTEKFIAVLDGQQNELFRVEGEDLYGTLYQLADGSMGIPVYTWDEATETSSQTLKTIDLAAKDWGAEYPLPINVYSLYRGSGDYLFYYRSNDSIYGFKAEAQAGEKLFSWIDADVNASNVLDFTFLEDGRVLALTGTWSGEDGYKAQLVTMTPTPRSEVPEKTTLVFGTMYLDYTTRDEIIQFNKTSTTHRIEVRDYSEYDTGDGTGALNRLNTEMLAGNVPDILSISDLPIRQYAAKGMLEDLWTWIDNDPDLGRDSLMEAPFNAASMDGKLYYIFNNYSVSTVVGSSDLVGDRTSWTVEDLQAALATMPEGATIFSKYDTKNDMLHRIVGENMDSFVDWTTGQCSFNTPEFKALLEFCNSFPAEYNYEEDYGPYISDYGRILNGQQMLSATYISSVSWGSITEFDAVFDGKYSYIGYPQEDGSVGSSFYIYDGLAMSSTCKDKDAAWSFMRKMLLSQESDDAYSGYYGDLYVNKADFDKAAEYAMREYEVDENGDVLLDENGDPVPAYLGTVWLDDSNQLELKPLTQESLDKFLEFFNSITKVYNFDQRIYDIVEGEVGAYFAGDATLDNVANLIQSKVQLYVGEQM